MADNSKPTAAAGTEAGAAVPGFREQTVEAYTTVKETILDQEKRTAAYEQAKGAVAQGIAVTKEALGTAEGRQQLLDQTKAVVTDTASHLTDAEKRAALLKNTKETVAYAAQGVKDPAVRQDIHDRAAAMSQAALSTVGLVPGATTAAAGTGTPAAAPGANPLPTSILPDPAATYAAPSMPSASMAHDMPGPMPSEGPSVSGMFPANGVPTSGAQAAAAAPLASLAGSVYPPVGGDTTGAVPHLKEH